MDTASSPARGTDTAPAPRPVPRLAGWTLTGLLAFWGIGAIGGGIGLAIPTEGSPMGFEPSLLDGTPFPDYLVPGLILLGLGVAATVVSVLLGRAVHRQRLPERLSPVLLLTALGINAWIFGEVAFLWSAVADLPQSERRVFYVFWVVYVALALAIGALAWLVTRRARPAT